MKRNATLDILKGICLILVIITHYPFSSATQTKLLFNFWVVMAIPLCMLVTGYVYALSFQRRGIHSLSQAYSARGGIVEHLIRYTVPFVIAWSVALVAFELIDLRAPLSPLGLIKEFLCGGDGQGSYYYPVMVQLVFLYPIIFFTIIRKNKKGLIICCVANIVYEILQWAYGLNSETYRLLVFRYVLLISFGCYFGLNGKMKTGTLAILFLIGLLSIYYITYKGTTLFFITQWQTTSFLTSLFVVPVFYFILKLDIRCKPLEIFGKASYHIFLVQMVFFKLGIVPYIKTFISNRILLFAACVSLCLIGGVFFYIIEAPITRYFINRYISFLQKRDPQ